MVERKKKQFHAFTTLSPFCFFLIWNKVRHGWAFYQLGQQKFCWQKCWANNFFLLGKWVKVGLLEMQNGIFSSTMCKTFQTAYGFFYTHKTEFGYYDSFFAQQKVISRIILRVKSFQIERTKEKNLGIMVFQKDFKICKVSQNLIYDAYSSLIFH